MSGRTSCIQRPAGSRFLIIREEYLTLCAGDHCAAAILGVFEYWHNNRLADLEQAEVEQAIAEKEGVETFSNGLWFYRTQPQLAGDVLHLFSERKIRDAIKYLLNAGYIQSRNNPRYRWDRTLQYCFSAALVQAAIDNLRPPGKIAGSIRRKRRFSSGRIAAAIQSTQEEKEEEEASSSIQGKNAGHTSYVPEVSEVHPTDASSIQDDTRDVTPLPYHIANGLGMTRAAKPETNALVKAVLAHPYWQAFARGWDGLAPALLVTYADITLEACKALEQKATVEEVEALTREKVRDPKRKGDYRLTFVMSDLSGFRARRRAAAPPPRLTDDLPDLSEAVDWDVNYWVRGNGGEG